MFVLFPVVRIRFPVIRFEAEGRWIWCDGSGALLRVGPRFHLIRWVYLSLPIFPVSPFVFVLGSSRRFPGKWGSNRIGIFDSFFQLGLSLWMSAEFGSWRGYFDVQYYHYQLEICDLSCGYHVFSLFLTHLRVFVTAIRCCGRSSYCDFNINMLSILCSIIGHHGALKKLLTWM